MFGFKKIADLFQRKMTTEEVMRELLRGRENATGISVNTDTALRLAAVFRCTNIIADCVSTVPCALFVQKDRNRAKAYTHPLYDVLTRRANLFQDCTQFFDTIGVHYALTRNAYVFINRNSRGAILELVPICPSKVTVTQKKDLSVVYEVCGEDGTRVAYPNETILHIRGPGWNGFMGYDAIKVGAETLGLSVALERSQARFFKNGMRPSGAYAVEGTLTTEQYAKLREHITTQTAGIDNTGVPLILDRAAKFISSSVTNVDAQQLESRKYAVEEQCRLMGVLPIMAGYSDKTATYASAEQMFIAHSVHTARPIYRRFEAAFNNKVLSDKEWSGGYYVKFIDSELLRGAALARAQYYREGINAGWLMRNEARGYEELNPIEGLDEPLTPSNMVVGNPPPAALNPSAQGGATQNGTP